MIETTLSFYSAYFSLLVCSALLNFLTRVCVLVSAERSRYQGGEVTQANEGEEEQGEEDPWCEEGMHICTLQIAVS